MGLNGLSGRGLVLVSEPHSDFHAVLDPGRKHAVIGRVVDPGDGVPTLLPRIERLGECCCSDLIADGGVRVGCRLGVLLLLSLRDVL